MSIDRNIVIKVHKSGESNSEIAKQLKMHNCLENIKKFQEIGTTLQGVKKVPDRFLNLM